VCHGKARILELLPADFARLAVEFRHVATTGDTVLVERVETLYRTDGSAIARDLAVLAAFQVRDGRICAWRDYFDHTNLHAGSTR
jgi:limonene-1,2-epoxide hydrolase